MTAHRLTPFILTALILASIGLVAFQQGPTGTLVQQSGTRLDASSISCTATGAGNTTVTCTLGTSVPSGQYVYVTYCTVDEVANAAIAGALGPAGVFTTTGLQTNLIWWADNATQTIGWHAVPMSVTWPTGLKTQSSGTAFTLAQTGGQSTQSFRINCGGYTAP